MNIIFNKKKFNEIFKLFILENFKKYEDKNGIINQ